MSASVDLQNAIVPILTAALSIPQAVLAVKPKELVSQLEIAAQDFGLSVHMLPPLPTHFLQHGPAVFFDRSEVRIRVTEWPDLNNGTTDGYDVCEEIALALHWMPFNKLNPAVHALMDAGATQEEANLAARADAALAPWWALSDIVAHPLQLASRPIEMVEDKEKRIFDVIFEAQYQINNPT